MAKLSVQKAKAEKQLASLKGNLRKLDEDKASLFREVKAFLLFSTPMEPHPPFTLIPTPPSSFRRPASAAGVVA